MVSGNVRLLRLKSMFQKCLQPIKVSGVQKLEVVTTQRLLMYYKYRVLNPCLKFFVSSRECGHFLESPLLDV